MGTNFCLDFCDIGRAVIANELQGLQQMLQKIDSSFSEACLCLLKCNGRIVVTGMGKSGHVGRKIAATLSSTGNPAFFMHPSEASHGDLGMITKQDVILAISNSGDTKEILEILPLFKRLNIPLISITGNPNSILAKYSNIVLNTGKIQEACPFNLAPTTTTTVALALGDALAIALLKARGFTEQDYAFRHPGGTLGKRLLYRVTDIMHTGEAIPQVFSGTILSDALIEMSRKGLGMTIVVNPHHQILGIFTDGDLRRAMNQKIDIHHEQIDSAMTKNCTVVPAEMSACEALYLMETLKINGFPVIDIDRCLIGAFNIHDLLKAGIF